MSSPYTGNPANITTPLTATINGATNASPIVISTTAAHLYATGDTVAINGVGGNTAANGTWTITVVDATHFSLNASTGNGAYTSGGTATDLSLTPQFQIPSDGDMFVAAAFNVAFQMLADRTQYLVKQFTLRSVTFTASGTWTVPASCVVAWGWGAGGGGGGAGGGAWTSATNQISIGGGGGGGVEATLQPLIGLIPGQTVTITIGAGGAGGTGTTSAPTCMGADGGSTTAVYGSTTKTWKGGLGGSCGNVTFINTHFAFAPGGFGLAGGQNVATYDLGTSPGASGITLFGLTGGLPCAGGSSITNGGTISNSEAGFPSTTGFTGGTGGAMGTVSASLFGGSGGGGGGAGAFGNGANGGNGGNGGGTGANGSVGANAGANTSAGGGGGGGTGAGSVSRTAGNGGTGGSGLLTIVYLSAA